MKHRELVGDNLHIARSMVGTGSPVGSVTPTIVGQFYIDDVTNALWRATGLTAVDWAQVSGGAGGASKVLSYGHFTAAIGNTTLWARVDWPLHVKSQAADLYDNFAEYVDCLWDIMEVDDGGNTNGVWIGRRFSTIAALYLFIAAHCVESGSNPGTPAYHVRVKVYDAINSDIDCIDKVWGMNNFYSMLRGRRTYRRTSCHAGDGFINWWLFPAWFEDLCNQNCGFGPGHAYSLGDEAALWWGRNEKKTYGLPKPGFDSEITMGNGRFVWDWGSSDFTPANPVTHRHGVIGVTVSTIMCAFDTVLGTWTWHDPTVLNDFMLAIIMPQYSWLMLYQIGDITDPNRRAIFVKPIGIDKVGLTWFNQSDYDLYAIHTRRDYQPVIRKVTSFVQQSSGKDLTWVARAAWRRPQDGCNATGYSTKMVGRQPILTKFFLRDKVTKEISKLSHATVAVAQRQRGIPFKFEVRS